MPPDPPSTYSLVNQAIIFPKGICKKKLTQFLHAFTAWVNLDLGIETYIWLTFAKAWLQFLFLVYVYILVGAMVAGTPHKL